MKAMKNIAYTGLILLMALVLSGCAKAETETDSNRALATAPNILEAKEQLYKAEEITVPSDFAPFAVRFLAREIFLFEGQRVLVLDPDGNELRRIILSGEETFAAFDLLADRSFWAMSLEFEEIESSDGKVPDKLEFVHFQRDGTELERIEADTGQFGKNEEVTYFRSFIFDGDYFYLMSAEAAYVLDKAGNLVMELNAAGENPENPRDSAYFRSLFRLKDGRAAVSSIIYGNEFSALIQIPDTETDDIEESHIPIANADHFFAAGKEAEILFGLPSGFYDYDLGTGNQRLIFDSLKHGINVNNLAEIAVLYDDTIAIAEWSQTGAVNRLTRFVPAVFTEEEEEELIEKEAVTLSLMEYYDTWLGPAIAAFNRDNRHYYVEVTSYKWDREGFNQFDLDLISGNIPDIIVLNDQISSNSYVKKGLFADLNEFIDNDPGFNRDDYLPALFTTLDRNGKLYELFPMFGLFAIQAKTADVGKEIGWTLDEFAEFIATKPDSAHIFYGWTKEWFIGRMVSDLFANPLTDEVLFDRDELEKILSIADRFPAAQLQEAELMRLLEGIKDGDPIMYVASISSFTDIFDYERLYFGEEITIKGFPSNDGNGLYFLPGQYFSIAARAENPDGAWEFLKYLMENARCNNRMNLPTNLASLDEMAKEVYRIMNDPGTTTTGNIRTMDLGYSQADLDKVMSAIKATEKLSRPNNAIYSIIMEEIGGYLSGQKSADAVADIIENRVGIYGSEQD
ncbi:MAG: extracellular solute-binding protein [Lachnospiraceae bacterium]|nr:extracellular solute-binding protein [Lachnospiraceae bacterium]